MVQNATDAVFHTIYSSIWTTTVVVAVAAFVLCAAWMRRQPFVTAFVAMWTIEIVVDAIIAGTGSSWLSKEAATIASLILVIAGDYRFFFLIERQARQPTTTPMATTTAGPAVWLGAFGFALFVPIVASSTFLPEEGTDGRWTYLFFESTFFVFVTILRLTLIPRRLRATTPAVRRWLLRVTHFELLQYALWITADIIILSGHDVGFALRLVPNVMYYALFLPFVAFSAPTNDVDDVDNVDHATRATS